MMDEQRVRVTVDRELCFGHGRCYVLAPEVFSEDEGGYCLIPREIVSDAAHVAEALVGESNCPENAIRVEPIGAGTTSEEVANEA